LVNTAVTLAVSTVISRSAVSDTTACGSRDPLESAAPDGGGGDGVDGAAPALDGAADGVGAELAAGFGAGGGDGATYVW